jgi:4,5-DOPA dioxygenase extradiol
MLSRRSLVLSGSLSAVMAALLPMGQALARSPQAPRKMPVLFIGHGSPMNAISANPFTQHLQRWGASLPRPSAILVVSAHWLTRGSTGVTVNDKPATIHDFSGFPAELHAMQYPAAGHPALAAKAAALVRSGQAQLTDQWGLDHGTWTVLHHLYPQADVPVFQVSIDYNQPAPYHYAVGKELAALREQGVLVIGSGNIVHNLRATVRGAPEGLMAARDWAQQFDEAAKQALLAGNHEALVAYQQLHASARMAVPTPDHYWPLLYALGAAHGSGPARQVFEGFQSGTISMRCLQWDA